MIHSYMILDIQNYSSFLTLKKIPLSQVYQINYFITFEKQ